jgi:2,3-bisphosphoglycerate-independent phosphoglycerate mutase
MPIPVILIIMDGLGEGKDYPGNAVKAAHTPNLDTLNKKYPHVLLNSSGNQVGVPKGVMGASEPGHLTLGAGRIVWQPFEEINQSIQDKSFFQKKDLIKACKNVQKKKSNLHLIGLLSDGGVHSHQKHLFALLKLAKQQKVTDVYLHLITDGRDVHERSIEQYLKELKKQIKKIGVGKIASIIGRFYAMDRDQNWKRTKVAYDLYTKGKGITCQQFMPEIKKYYKKAKENEDTDYYLPAFKSISDFKGIEKQDSVIFFNFRSDRARQLTAAFVEPKFNHFTVKVKPYFVCMGPYSDQAPVVFPPAKVKNNLGEYLSKKGLKQLRIAETEKYAHVTFFFNSQLEKPYKNEDRILIKSPKVSNYAQKPEMSANLVTKRIIKEIKSEKYDFILLNYANPDLVGHSGDFKAAVKAVEVVDECVGKVVEAALKHHYELIITADHGNAEEMLYCGTKTVCPAHTTNPVNCLVVSERVSKLKKQQGLANIAGTVLELMGVTRPKEIIEGLIIGS